MLEATFTGRSVLTTGATGRIGQAVATEFGRRGGHVLAAGRDRERGKTVARQIRSHGGRADFIPGRDYLYSGIDERPGANTLVHRPHP